MPFLIGISRKKFIGKIVAEGRGLGVGMKSKTVFS